MDFGSQYDKIFRYCYYKIKNQDIAEDLTQDTFLRFLKSGYREQGKQLQYLYTIARNLCIDHYRKNNVDMLIPVDDEQISESLQMEDNIAMRSDVWRVLGTLSEEDREILLLRYVNEEKDAVICKVFGISRFSLYRRLRKLRSVLREQLSDYLS